MEAAEEIVSVAKEESTSLVSKNNNGVTSSSSSSSNNIAMLKATADEEDQEMANCLILLAQGHNRNHHQPQPPSQPQQQTRQFMISYQDSGKNNNGYRSSSRRFLETSNGASMNGGSGGGGGGGRAGYYVYQCKTCDRTFPSFQALGGHRASHKKPKAAAAAAAAGLYSDHNLKKPIYDDTVSLHLNNINHRSPAVYGKASDNKVHECGICGAEFTSGQALGGHMRRHRGAIVAATAASNATVAVTATTATANTALSLSPMSFDQMSETPVQTPVKRARSAVVSLDLDLFCLLLQHWSIAIIVQNLQNSSFFVYFL